MKLDAPPPGRPASTLSACGDDAGSGGAPRVVATTTQAADLARQVAGDRAEVTSILKPNSDPHAYEPRAGDVKALARADLVVRSGGEIDEWLEEAQAGAGSDAPVLTLGENTREEPHWWQDPRAAERAVTVLRDGLTKADAGGKATYAANAERYLGELRRLDGAIARCIATIPPAKRKLVTTHDALGRLRGPLRARGDRDGDPLALDRRPGLGGRDGGAREDDPARARAGGVRGELGALGRRGRDRARGRRPVAPALWADSLGPKGSSGATYIASMEANTHTIAAALGGDLASCP